MTSSKRLCLECLQENLSEYQHSNGFLILLQIVCVFSVILACYLFKRPVLCRYCNYMDCLHDIVYMGLYCNSLDFLQDSMTLFQYSLECLQLNVSEYTYCNGLGFPVQITSLLVQYYDSFHANLYVCQHRYSLDCPQ